jgi:hypothetical protein
MLYSVKASKSAHRTLRCEQTTCAAAVSAMRVSLMQPTMQFMPAASAMWATRTAGRMPPVFMSLMQLRMGHHELKALQRRAFLQAHG